MRVAAGTNGLITNDAFSLLLPSAGFDWKLLQQPPGTIAKQAGTGTVKIAGEAEFVPVSTHGEIFRAWLEYQSAKLIARFGSSGGWDRTYFATTASERRLVKSTSRCPRLVRTRGVHADFPVPAATRNDTPDEDLVNSVAPMRTFLTCATADVLAGGIRTCWVPALRAWAVLETAVFGTVSLG